MSNSGLAVVQPQNQIAHQQQGLNEDQIQLITDTICKGANRDELALFIQVCNRTGLDPFARQIFAVKRWDGTLKREVLTSQISIDGMRLIAERSSRYEGQVGPFWCGQDGKWTDVWLKPDEAPYAAKVGVHRAGAREPIWAVALWHEYAQTTKEGRVNSMWSKFGTVMLAKCAESLALRKAFPFELSGLYTQEEMGQAGGSTIEAEPVKHEATVQQPAADPAPATPPAGDDPDLPPCRILSQSSKLEPLKVLAGELRGNCIAFTVQRGSSQAKALYFNLAHAAAVLTGPNGEDPVDYRGEIVACIGLAQGGSGPFTFLAGLQPVIEADDSTEEQQ